VALAVTPVFLVLTTFYGGRMKGQWRAAKEIESSALSVVQEALTAVRVVKSFQREEYEEERFVRQSQDGMAARIRAVVEESVYTALVGVTTSVGMAAVLFFGMR